MKARLIDKILLVFLLLIFIAAVTAAILCLVGVFPADSAAKAADSVITGDGVFVYVRIGIIVVLGILGIIALKLLFTNWHTVQKEENNSAALLTSDECGSAYISAACIDSMAQRYLKTNNRIKECSSKIAISPDSSVDITLKAIVLADTNIPELSEKVRSELKTYIESLAGITVNKIAFMVVNTYTPATVARIN